MKENDNLNIFGRRKFLLLMLLGVPVVLGIFSQLRHLFSLTHKDSYHLKYFSTLEQSILKHIFQSIVSKPFKLLSINDQRECLRFFVKGLDKYLENIHWQDRFQLKFAIYLFDLMPILWGPYFKDFCSLNEIQKKKYIEKIENQKWIIKLIFLTFKEVSYLFFYSFDKTWSLIEYDGPTIENEIDSSNFQKDYEKLIFKGIN